MVSLYTSSLLTRSEVGSLTIDALDARLLALLADEPRIGVLECARRLQVARGTVQARLEKVSR